MGESVNGLLCRALKPYPFRLIEYRHFVGLCKVKFTARTFGVLPAFNEQDAVAAVAPRAGAWIETFSGVMNAARTIVAPRAGAWIETLTLTRAGDIQ